VNDLIWYQKKDPEKLEQHRKVLTSTDGCAQSYKRKIVPKRLFFGAEQFFSFNWRTVKIVPRQSD